MTTFERRAGDAGEGTPRAAGERAGAGTSGRPGRAGRRGGGRASRRATALAVLSLALGCARGRVAAPAPVPAAEASPHGGPGREARCDACHVRRGEPGLVAAPVAVCGRCHPTHDSHPVDVVQRTPAPGIPLAGGERVACHSCHDPHDLSRHERGLRLEFDALCIRCHAAHAPGGHGALK